MKKTVLFLLLIIISISAQTTPQESLQKLQDGNARFCSGNLAEKDFKTEIEMTAEGQSPYAIIVACSDSRVAPETIFDESIGKLFVIRLAGNVIDTAAIGSIEYAVKYLHSSYLLMLGHTHCGAVHATVTGKNYTPSINAIAKMISPAYQKAQKMVLDENNILYETIKENVYLQSQNLLNNSREIENHINDGSLKMGEAIYDISTGKVVFLEE